MSVLARDIDAYKRAVERYNREIKGYNRGIENYNQSLVLDANGNAVVRDALGNVFAVDRAGKTIGYNLPEGKTVADYGSQPIPGSPYLLMRQNPAERRTESVRGVIRQEDADGGGGQYVVPNNEGSGQVLGPEWKMISEQGPTTEGGNPTYTFEKDASIYRDRPEAFKGQTPKAPDPSMAQVRRMFTGSVADRERGGLLNDAIRSKGLKTGGTPTQYRSGSVYSQPDPQTPPGDPPPIIEDPQPYGANRATY